jgi:hypothetical protein
MGALASTTGHRSKGGSFGLTNYIDNRIKDRLV